MHINQNKANVKKITEGYINTPKIYSPFLICSLYFLIILIISFLRHGVAHESNHSCDSFSSSFLNYSIEQIYKCYGPMDVASYIKGAFVIYEGGINAYLTQGFGTWPPGFSILELFLIKLNIASLQISLIFVTYLCWSLVLYYFYLLIRDMFNLSFFMTFLTPLLLLWVPFVENFYLWNGLMMSEPISTAMFFMAILDFWRLALQIGNVSLMRFMPVGLLVVFAIYLRAQFDILFHVLILSALFLVLIILFIARHRKLEFKIYENTKKILNSLFIVLIVVQVFIVPYKLYMSKHGFGFNMIAGSHIFKSIWNDDQYLIKNGAGFFVGGGGNVLCSVDGDKCEDFRIRKVRGEEISNDEYRNATLYSILSNPFDFFKAKIPFFWSAWIVNIYESPNEISLIVIFNYLIAFSILLGLIIKIFINFWQGILNAYLLIFFFIGTSLFSWVVHFEARYLLPFKLMGVIWLITIIFPCAEYFKNKIKYK